MHPKSRNQRVQHTYFGSTVYREETYLIVTVFTLAVEVTHASVM